MDAFWKNCDLGMTLCEKNLNSLRDPGSARKHDHYRGVTPFEVVFQLDTMRVLRFCGQAPSEVKNPLLVVPSLINRSYVVDLMENNSLVADLLAQGIPVYMIDWGNPGPQHDKLSFEFYVDDLIHMAVKAVLRDRKAPKASLLGYCMGGTMCLLHAALYPEIIDRVTLLAAPVDFHHGGTLSHWVSAKVFNVEKVVNVLGHAEAWMLQSSFLFLKPLSYYQKIKGAYETCTDPKAMQNFVGLESWVNDNTGVPGRAYADFVKFCYQDNTLMKKSFLFKGNEISLQKMTSQILVVIATKDHIVPPASSRGISCLLWGSGKVKEVELEAGHIGIVMGRRAKKMFEILGAFHKGDVKMPAGDFPGV